MHKKKTFSVNPVIIEELKPILKRKGAKMSSVVQILLEEYLKDNKEVSE